MSDETIILLAKDTDDGAEICQQALKNVPVEHRCIRVNDGDQCIKYLEGITPFADRREFPVPDLLLLDLDMPVMTGLDVLEWLQNRPEYDELPVMLLSDWESKAERETVESKRQDYGGRPMETEDVLKVLEAIGRH